MSKWIIAMFKDNQIISIENLIKITVLLWYYPVTGGSIMKKVTPSGREAIEQLTLPRTAGISIITKLERMYSL